MRNLLLLLVLIAAQVANAQLLSAVDKWECQSTARAGLIWDAEEWKATGFKHSERFTLIPEGDSISVSSVASAMGVELLGVNCTQDNEARRTFCLSRWVAASFAFDPKVGRGAIAFILGAASGDDDYRDSVDITPFECVKVPI
jgi:hypothetical protein